MRRKNQRGSAILESALVFSSMLFMIIGTLDFGQVMFRHQSLVERARFAARWAVTQTYSDSIPGQTRNLVMYFTTDPGDEPPMAFWGLSSGDVNVQKVIGIAGEPDRLVIRITNRFLMVSPYIGGNHNGRDITISLPYEAL